MVYSRGGQLFSFAGHFGSFIVFCGPNSIMLIQTNNVAYAGRMFLLLLYRNKFNLNNSLIIGLSQFFASKVIKSDPKKYYLTTLIKVYSKSLIHSMAGCRELDAWR